jgi:hypothetical protein
MGSWAVGACPTRWHAEGCVGSVDQVGSTASELRGCPPAAMAESEPTPVPEEAELALASGGWSVAALVLCHSQNLACGKGVRSQLCEAPVGPFRQLTPDPFTTPIPKRNGDKAIVAIRVKFRVTLGCGGTTGSVVQGAFVPAAED